MSVTSTSVARAVLRRERTSWLATASAWAPWLLLCALAAWPILGAAVGLDYYTGFTRRVLIVALAATSLNFLVGVGGMVALGHAGFLGVGAYTLVALSEAGVSSAWVLWAGAMAVSALVALVIGAVSLRTRGVYFIMITLAFAQMLYYIAVSLRAYGGDDGYNLAQRPWLGLGLDANPELGFHGVVLGLSALWFWFFSQMLGSRFGKAIVGIRDNEARMAALGHPVFALKLMAFAIAGAAAGLAGALLVMHNGFVSPSSMHWSQSATLIVMVVLGGLGSRWGGLVGAAVWMTFEELLRPWTEYWHWPLGLALIAIVLVAPQGLAALALRAGQRRNGSSP
ncbi:branched-chain amino acid ABC transporter permease [Variovorax sp. J31P207]|uniref:branched-chain amino acid ABC transporter permease n=1 Tax=Variovorax sp. J31P207 TaxID=3053510 RepID=UPI002578EF60|nr:branched-chain amino acid ABC transporter permease [Variovorax sp. J31P207]MDM0068241.1 branched-chain amino acid ABC transporter permease [Variovorax sp. J31P207]